MEEMDAGPIRLEAERYAESAAQDVAIGMVESKEIERPGPSTSPPGDDRQ
ncbi:MAG TPA: hypothetical protein VH279_02490 [Solirubrobacteraceae bacterium]|nr:hypothetical protein [Solirubrobacteraceae bacterium]